MSANMAKMAQLRRKNIKKTVFFNVMVVGASGSGKTSFINTLVESPLLLSKTFDVQETDSEKTLVISPTTIDLEEEQKITLTIIDTPG